MTTESRPTKSHAAESLLEPDAKGALQEPFCLNEASLAEFDGWMSQQLGELEDRFRHLQTRESLLLSMGR